VHCNNDWTANKQLRIVWTGGERLVAGPPMNCPFALWNVYAPTECCVTCTMSCVEPLDEQPSIGKPMGNTR